MAEMTGNINTEVDHLFRKTYGKLISSLMNKYGATRLESIENAVMEAYYKALKTWPYQGKPEHPQGWLYRTAQNAFIDIIRKETRSGETDLTDKHTSDLSIEEHLVDESVSDPELKLLFLICHPYLSKEDQLAFMLKTLAGLGDREISRALMIKQATIKKRLMRARRTIKEKSIKFEWPGEHELQSRLKMVHRSLYLLFNEGFYSTHQDLWIRKDLCLEAMRLCKYLADHRLSNTDTFALMSLMCYHISRYESRLDDNNNIVLLNEQDRSKWDPYFIKLGHHYLEKSASSSEEKSKYQVEAFISAQHCMAKNIESTNWKLLKLLYEKLYYFDKQDLVLLNLVIVHLHLDEITEAKVLFDNISINNFNSNKTIYYMVGVELYSRLKDQFQIELLLERAISSSGSEKESHFLKDKLEKIKRSNQH